MAEQAWRVFNKAREYLMDGGIDLDTDTFNITLHTSAAALTTALLDSITVLGSVGSEVTSTSGYSTSGTALQSVTWTSGASTAEMRFDCADVVVTALGSDIANIKFAVISDATQSNRLLAYSRLSTSQYTVTAGNTHTITIAAGGIFELNGGG